MRSRWADVGAGSLPNTTIERVVLVEATIFTPAAVPTDRILS
jgi:hypothetical protein